jgi:DNA-binding winged helix-turn-helix (wHTH) protein
MANDQYREFASFRLDLENAQLWREFQVVPLRPRIFAVLRYLMEHPQRLIRREELVQAVWDTTKVSEGVLRVCVREIRQALSESAEKPRFIETVGRQGWKWIAEVVSRQGEGTRDWGLGASPPSPQAPTVVGRERELVQLHE